MTMIESEYKIELRTVLDNYSAQTIELLNETLKAIPEKVQEVEITIFPDQDGEGTFSIRTLLSGPDLYVLNKAIEKTAELFNVKHTPNGLEPSVPLMDPFDEEFDVNNVLCDTAAKWLEELWVKVEKKGLEIPVSIVAEEYYGDLLPMKLKI